jgi:predicted XRE-type DNA-binding protein
MRITKSCGNIFKDVGFSDAEAKKLNFKSSLIISLVKYIKEQSMTQKQAAKFFGVSQPRISDLFNHKIDLFSGEMLLNMLAKTNSKAYEAMNSAILDLIDNDY